MAKLDLSNVVTVTVQAALRGLANVNTSALAIIAKEEPIPNDFGTSRNYRSTQGVGEDFGTTSDTYRLATAIFAQAPNILTGGGFLVIIPRLQAAAATPATLLSETNIDLTALTASDYNIRAAVDGGVAGDLLIGAIDSTNLTTAAASLNSTAVTGAGIVFTLSGTITSAKVTLKTASTGAASDVAITAATTGTDIATLLKISGTATGTGAGLESIKDAILRTTGNVDYFGIIYDEKMADTVLTETANLVQTLDKIQFVASNLQADITGIFDTVRSSGLTHTRCLYYSTSEDDALDFAAAYASRGLSVNMSGTDTALTMNLKLLAGIEADPGMAQSVADLADAAGVDIYVDYGISRTKTSGANVFFDSVYTSLAFKLRVQIAAFNYLARTSTKIPQTETGMSGYKSAIGETCEEFATNGSVAPGQWNGPTFGDPETFLANIEQKGYYVFSQPVAQQSQTERSIRAAPVVQIALKESGAIHNSNIIVNIQE